MLTLLVLSQLLIHQTVFLNSGLLIHVISKFHVRLQILTSTNAKTVDLYDVAPRSVDRYDLRFGAAYYLHHQGEFHVVVQTEC
jgi:hypothetical protein